MAQKTKQAFKIGAIGAAEQYLLIRLNKVVRHVQTAIYHCFCNDHLLHLQPNGPRTAVPQSRRVSNELLARQSELVITDLCSLGKPTSKSTSGNWIRIEFPSELRHSPGAATDPADWTSTTVARECSLGTIGILFPGIQFE